MLFMVHIGSISCTDQQHTQTDMDQFTHTVVNLKKNQHTGGSLGIYIHTKTKSFIDLKNFKNGA